MALINQKKMDDTLIKQLMFTDLLDYYKKSPYEYMYVGIGSVNRTTDLEKFNADTDQILPVFLDSVKSTIRILHLDPAFNYECNDGFLDKYFKSKNFTQTKLGDHQTWFSMDNRIEVIVIPTIYTDDYRWVLHELINQTLANSSKLVVQQYCGPELIPTFERILPKFKGTKILKHVLFDFTYGEACHCMTPMTQYAPIMDENGDFYNLVFYSEEKLLTLVGKSPKIDKHIKTRILQSFAKTLNQHHVNYRRATRGEARMFDTHLYTENTPPNLIMKILLNELSKYMRVLDKLNYLTTEKFHIFNVCSQNYETVDLYKWYTEMAKICK